jgi:hypothetical protein
MKAMHRAFHRRRGRWQLPGSAGSATETFTKWCAQSPKEVG